jgi:Conserved in the green lineage and diatoms 27
MNSLIKIFLLCPIPEDQKPMNEYIGLRNNFLLKIIESITSVSGQTIGFIFFLLLLFLFAPTSFLSTWMLPFSIFCFTFCFFLLVIRFLIWKQLQQRFQTCRIFYEEASWYDGQIWEKPLYVLKNDRFLSTQRLEPFLETIRSQLVFWAFVNIGFLFLFLLK